MVICAMEDSISVARATVSVATTVTSITELSWKSTAGRRFSLPTLPWPAKTMLEAW